VTTQAEQQLLEKRRRRIKLTKRLLRPLPRRATLHRYPVIKWFADTARSRPYLWTFRVSAVIPSIYAGSILSLLPLYGVQIALAFALALLLRANLPVLVALQFVTNPLSAGPIYYTTLKVGHYVSETLGLYQPESTIGHGAHSLFIGGIVCGTVLGLVLALVYRFLAYEASKHHWHLPRIRRKSDDSASPPSDDGPDV
jgi:uncharacterized protein (DUF2062 family)